ncbi:hypothetical protein SAMN05216378_4392 [Paenibacillus catalpae]|uniref:Uncharacterized protein n=1 Tax=Paenibacillus catalpae TaxID=1045775 RepID=A0A1I2E1N0_9BACL|nr:DUF6339 family protein [Paenibacillus catalpae]SFE86804.1 hypothetical protein SAMN05216378_4392 [Paenibacillus catalpae]
MNWKTMNSSDLQYRVSSWNDIGEVHETPAADYLELREELLQIEMEVKSELQISTPKGREYAYDLSFGLKLYQVLKKYDMTEAIASDNQIWAYLGVAVIPDIVFKRWGAQAHDRFYQSPRRIWLKVLWWYIHLSWQGTEELTRKVLLTNTTDEVVQLVERSGNFGYRIKLCREIMLQYGQFDNETKTRSGQLFRRVMKLNTARLAVIEPALYEGEECGYVTDLFKEIVNSKFQLASSH